ncbi:DUF1566 domain-containing protein [Crocinitomicaceae bacterium]|uniref:Vir region protein n=1 Tax=uncultured Flavobacteriia bacterium TaxID=212695 RepID=H6RDR5_9BACT|nr:hypothetical protein [uncultured bacterium]MDC1283083.1 DUF1566 domain-containing protein [Crocinitomicaceae bacterium]CCF99176.1 vir region protein [uncultured Flavobacteriia bacterium]
MKTLLLFGALALSITAFGQDVKTVEIGDLEVMTEDLGELSWDKAKEACAALGEGWRVPTKDELNILYENKDKIGGFNIDTTKWGYWSSTEGVFKSAWRQHFSNGFQSDASKATSGTRYAPGKPYLNYVRAVRTL